ncbi:MAG TPA: hypothetical protein VEA77_01530 [Hyphomicrobium sp.]|nr:hypothetical protein [Hyphomicrobium sp.]
MTFEQRICTGDLMVLPMKAWLKPTGVAAPSPRERAWVLEQEWTSSDEEPHLVEVALRLLNLNGSMCCAIKGRAIAADREGRHDDERAIVYLLNPADPSVWESIDSWMRTGYMTVCLGPGKSHSTSVGARDVEALKARGVEGEELESDMLAASILKLLKEGRLESEVAQQLGIKVPVCCVIVETPMMYKSLLPVDEEKWRLHKEHEASRLESEGIAS